MKKTIILFLVIFCANAFAQNEFEIGCYSSDLNSFGLRDSKKGVCQTSILFKKGSWKASVWGNFEKNRGYTKKSGSVSYNWNSRQTKFGEVEYAFSFTHFVVGEDLGGGIFNLANTSVKLNSKYNFGFKYNFYQRTNGKKGRFHIVELNKKFSKKNLVFKPFVRIPWDDSMFGINKPVFQTGTTISHTVGQIEYGLRLKYQNPLNTNLTKGISGGLYLIKFF